MDPTPEDGGLFPPHRVRYPNGNEHMIDWSNSDQVVAHWKERLRYARKRLPQYGSDFWKSVEQVALAAPPAAALATKCAPSSLPHYRCCIKTYRKNKRAPNYRGATKFLEDGDLMVLLLQSDKGAIPAQLLSCPSIVQRRNTWGARLGLPDVVQQEEYIPVRRGPRKKKTPKADDDGTNDADDGEDISDEDEAMDIDNDDVAMDTNDDHEMPTAGTEANVGGNGIGGETDPGALLAGSDALYDKIARGASMQASLNREHAKKLRDLTARLDALEVQHKALKDKCANVDSEIVQHVENHKKYWERHLQTTEHIRSMEDRVRMDVFRLRERVASIEESARKHKGILRGWYKYLEGKFGKLPMKNP